MFFNNLTTDVSKHLVKVETKRNLDLPTGRKSGSMPACKISPPEK